MDEMVYEALSRYYNTLEKTGYMSYDNAVKLLILIFLKDFVFNDYRCILDKDDYRLIERALNCLYGTTCLIPYPDYLKMGKLRLGDMAELACRVKAIEDANVVKVIHDPENWADNPASDVEILMNDEITTSTAQNPTYTGGTSNNPTYSGSESGGSSLNPGTINTGPTGGSTGFHT